MKNTNDHVDPVGRKAIRSLKLAGIVALAVLVPSCGGNLLGLPQGPAPDIYTLTPKSTFDKGLPKVKWQLVVDQPTAARGLDTRRIALHPSPTQIKYYAGARWTDRAPDMVQTLLLESFENTNKIVAVGRQTIGLRSDFDLAIDLREFQAEYHSGNDIPDVRVRMNVKIIKQPRQEIIASKNFEYVAKSKGTSVNDVVLAFDDALGKVLRRVVEWTLITANKSAEETRIKALTP
ncbi:MAG TPA: ABC-type transport auxiliary lipoprotein family protein [Alphaproteobacteria bacterium]|nr:ABC-type transport auxiliary lipoprotein family protein [Alphaproteobacteria bacterium]